ncbi:MAG TPA: hypothetical protein VOA80_12445, partial [Thermoanaerobaculia bacterium]|nr:hypothetical protein [Thermoanaerobaculia bacterium]
MNDRVQAVRVEQPAAAPRGRHLPVAVVAALLGALAWFAATAPVAASASLPSRPAGTGTGGATQFALIVNGDDSFTHNYNVALSLASLSQLGYAPENTLVLAPPASADGAGSAAAGPTPWRQPATEQGLRQAFAQLRGRMRSGDRLLVYLTGHGYRMFGRTSLELQGGSITAHELMQRLAELPFGKLILIADQCYSGGFANAALALGRNVVAVSSTDDRHEVRCEPFIRPLWLAAVAAESDTRGNGFVSVEEAFQVAADGLRQGGAGSGGEAPHIAASGTCSGHENSFGETA